MSGLALLAQISGSESPKLLLSHILCMVRLPLEMQLVAK